MEIGTQGVWARAWAPGHYRLYGLPKRRLDSAGFQTPLGSERTSTSMRPPDVPVTPPGGWAPGQRSAQSSPHWPEQRPQPRAHLSSSSNSSRTVMAATMVMA